MTKNQIDPASDLPARLRLLKERLCSEVCIKRCKAIRDPRPDCQDMRDLDAAAKRLEMR